MQNHHPEEFDEDIEARRRAELAFLKAVGPRSELLLASPDPQERLERIAAAPRPAGITPAAELRALAAPLTDAFRPSLRAALDAVRADLDAAGPHERDGDMTEAFALLEAARAFASDWPGLDEVERLAAEAAHAAGKPSGEGGGARRRRG